MGRGLWISGGRWCAAFILMVIAERILLRYWQHRKELLQLRQLLKLQQPVKRQQMKQLRLSLLSLQHQLHLILRLPLESCSWYRHHLGACVRYEWCSS